MEEDLELKLINARKLAEMKRRAEKAPVPKAAAPSEQKSSKAVLLSFLYDRGDEVLEAAYSAYPRETALIVDQLAALVKSGKLVEKISGGELYAVMRELGLRFSMKTSIKVQDKGKLVDLSEKLKSDRQRAEGR